MSEEERKYWEEIIELIKSIKEDLKECLKGDEEDEII